MKEGCTDTSCEGMGHIWHASSEQQDASFMKAGMSSLLLHVAQMLCVSLWRLVLESGRQRSTQMWRAL